LNSLRKLIITNCLQKIQAESNNGLIFKMMKSQPLGIKKKEKIEKGPEKTGIVAARAEPTNLPSAKSTQIL
jgi:hypothetical protein